MSQKFYIPVESIAQLQSESEHQLIVAVAYVDSFPKSIPLSPNVREPNKKTTTFKEIVNTLIMSPDKFLARNNGIKIAAKSITLDKGKSGIKGLFIECDRKRGDFRGHGIYDGGHTVAAFSSAKVLGADLKLARVKLEIVCGVSDDEIALNSLAANTVSNVDKRSKINAKGGFDFIRAYIQEIEATKTRKYKIAYYQNQTGVPTDKHCSILHLCKILICLDRIKYNPLKPGTSQHPISLTIPNFDNPDIVEKMQKILPLFPQGLRIERLLYNEIADYFNHPQVKGTCNLAAISINGNSMLMDGTTYGFNAPETLAMPVISAFRVFLDDDFQWILPFNSFAKQLVEKLWGYLRNELKKEKAKGANGILGLYRQQRIWADLCMIALTERDEIMANLKREGAIKLLA